MKNCIKSLIYNVIKINNNDLKIIKTFENFRINEIAAAQPVVKPKKTEKPKNLGDPKKLVGVDFNAYAKNVLKDSDTNKLSGCVVKVKIIEASDFETGASNLWNVKVKCNVEVEKTGENEQENEYFKGSYGIMSKLKEFTISGRIGSSGTFDQVNIDEVSNSIVVKNDSNILKALNSLFSTSFKYGKFDDNFSIIHSS